MKICKLCNEEKPLEEFPRAKTCVDQRRGSCRKCHYARLKKPIIDPKNERSRSLRKQYWPHLSNDEATVEYTNLLQKQNNCCAICKRHKSEFKRPLFVDHCHVTKAVRGLLCRSCNLGIGFLEADLGNERLKAALTYLSSVGNSVSTSKT